MWYQSAATLHHLSLQVASRLLTLHGSAFWILGIIEAERATAVLVALEFLDRGLGVTGVGELDDTAASRAAIWLVLDLSTLDGSNGLEELNQIFVAGAPRQL